MISGIKWTPTVELNVCEKRPQQKDDFGSDIDGAKGNERLLCTLDEKLPWHQLHVLP